MTVDGERDRGAWAGASGARSSFAGGP